MKEKVLKTIKDNNLIEAEDKIVVGVSGGPDSMSLLNILYEIKNEKKLGFNFEIVVAHINHGIREEAISDELYVKEYCDKYGILFFSKRFDILKIAKEKKIGTEEMGRKARYDFFDEVLNNVNATKIATAHTKNDNAETVMMNILRGTGPQGLKGIEAIRDKKYIRPLINIKREEIEKYCKENNLNPRIDKTNFENVYTRNKVRNMLIPYIEKEFNPNFIDTINRLSDIAKKENDYIEKMTKEAYKDVLIEKKQNEIILDLKAFNSKDEVIKNRLVLYTINELFGSSQGIEKIHIQDIIKLCNNNIGNKFLIPNKKVKVLVKNKKIFYICN